MKKEMGENVVAVSDDRMELVISSPEGNRATLRSARPDGFTDAEIEHARAFRMNANMTPNQVNRARRIQLGSRVVYAHFNVGPPTWWKPRMEVKRGKVMIGWMRVLVALSWDDGEEREA